MTRARIFFITAAALIVARASDLLTTFHFNPSLSLEANPVVLVFGGGIASLIAITVIVSAVEIVSLVVFWRGRALVLRGSVPDTATGFVRLWLKRVLLDRQPFTAYLPGGSRSNEGLQSVRLFGVGLSWALIFASLTGVYSWVAIWRNHHPGYKAVFSYIAIGRFSLFPATVALLGFLFGASLFFQSEHLESKKQ